MNLKKMIKDRRIGVPDLVFGIVMAALIIAGGFYYLRSGDTDTPYVSGGVRDKDETNTNTDIKEIRMTASQWEFDPASITVDKGDRVKLIIESADVAHGFGIREYGIEQKIPEKGKTTVEFVADKTGAFTYYCTVHCGAGHMRMVGRLTVKGSGGSEQNEYEDINEDKDLDEDKEKNKDEKEGGEEEEIVTGETARTVLIEAFTSVDCYWCNLEEEPALKRIAEDYDRNEVVILAYHGFYGEDPWETSAGNSRANYYGGVSGTPNVWFDGTTNKVGGTGQGVDAMYDVYNAHIAERAPISSPVSISLEGSITGSTARVVAEVDERSDAGSGDLRVRFALVEDGLEHKGKRYDWVVRDISEGAVTKGELPSQLSRSFPVDADWNGGNLRAVVWVQDDTDREVQQAAYYGFGE